MEGLAGPFSSSSTCPDSRIDIVQLFNSPPPSHLPGAASSSASSAPQQISSSPVPYNVNLAVNLNGETELRFEAADADIQSPTPESWTFSGSADVGVDNYCCCFSADSKHFITGGVGAGGWSTYQIRLWDPSTRTLAATLTGHTSHFLSAVSFNLNGRIMLATGSQDASIWIWQLKEPASASRRITALEAGEPVRSLVFCSKQNVLISAQAGVSNSSIKFWSPINATTWECVHTVSFPSGRVTALSLSCDESKLASSHSDGSIRIWDMDSRAEVKSWKAATERVTVHGLYFSPCQPHILVAAANDGTCTTWNCDSESMLGSVPCQVSHSMAPCLPCPFSPNGSHFATVSRSNQLVLVDAATSVIVKTVDGSPSVKSISSVCFSPDGKYLACATQSGSRSFYIWESNSSLEQRITVRSIVPEPASDFRIVELAKSTSACLIVVRLSSGKYAITKVEVVPSSPFQLSISNEWTVVPSSIQRPLVSLETSGGPTLKVEEQDS